jgi:hypothetical protein
MPESFHQLRWTACVRYVFFDIYNYLRAQYENKSTQVCKPQISSKNLRNLQECQTRKKISLTVFAIFMPAQLIFSFIQIFTI